MPPHSGKNRQRWTIGSSEPPASGANSGSAARRPIA
jgi:hypothetical protein